MNLINNIKVTNRHNIPSDSNARTHPKNQTMQKEKIDSRVIQKQNFNNEKMSEGMKKKKISEGDFSRISQSYILEGNYLKKQEIYKQDKNKGKAQKENEVKAMKDQKQDIRTKIIKLEYLEEKGVLRPEEKEILKKYRNDVLGQKEASTNPNKQKQNQKPKLKSSQQNGIKLDSSYLNKIEKPYNTSSYFTPKPHFNQDPYFYSSRKADPLDRSQGPYGSRYQKVYPQFYA